MNSHRSPFLHPVVYLLTSFLAVAAVALLQFSQYFWLSAERVERLHHGMNREQVAGLLGSPFHSNNAEWVYCPFFNFADLHVDFDTSGRVSSFGWLD